MVIKKVAKFQKNKYSKQRKNYTIYNNVIAVQIAP